MTDTLTLGAAAQQLGVSEDSLEELLRAGALPVRTVRGERRIPAEDLERYHRDRERAHAGLRRMADVVNESAGGWDY